jgi:hypothetical protein
MPISSSNKIDLPLWPAKRLNIQRLGRDSIAWEVQTEKISMYVAALNPFSCTTLVALTTLLLDRTFSSLSESRAQKIFEKRFPQTKKLCARMTLC